MVSSIESQLLLSVENFLQLPETKPASEYIDGKIYQKPMPQGKHSIVQTELSSTINQVDKSRHLALALTELRWHIWGTFSSSRYCGI